MSFHVNLVNTALLLPARKYFFMMQQHSQAPSTCSAAPPSSWIVGGGGGGGGRGWERGWSPRPAHVFTVLCLSCICKVRILLQRQKSQRFLLLQSAAAASKLLFSPAPPAALAPRLSPLRGCACVGAAAMAARPGACEQCPCFLGCEAVKRPAEDRREKRTAHRKT